MESGKKGKLSGNKIGGLTMQNKDLNNIYWALLKHQQWNMYVAATDKGLCYIGSPNASFEEFDRWAKKRLPGYNLVEEKEIIEPYSVELVDYLEGRLKNFTLPMDLQGTQFQQSVWQALRKLQYGQTVSYTDIAERIGKPKSVRAVATAIGANPVLILVPCHRVVAKNGKLGGFRAGLEMKKELLKLEE